LIKPTGNKLRRIKRYSAVLTALAGIILIPVGIILSSLLKPGSEIWTHVQENLILSYIMQTLGLAGGVLVAASVIGVSLAWIVVSYDFPLKKLISTLLIIPMAIPAYINAFTYAGIVDYTGPLQTFFRNTLSMESGYPVIDIMNLPGAIFIMTLALYPYIYLPVRSAFRQQAGTINDAARVLGVSGYRLFFRVSLPLIRPALVGGAILVLMEVLNEYGAVHYYGVNTLTVGIFRSWFSLSDLTAAMKLSAYLLLAVLTILLSERKLRERIGYSLPLSKPFVPKKTGKIRGAALAAICFLPLLAGFLIPLLQLLDWAFQAGQSLFSPLFLELMKNSFLLTGFTTLLILFLAVISSYILRSRSIRFRRELSSVLTLGYAIPGTVIAIGIMIAFGFADRQINNLLAYATGAAGRLFLSGSLAALVIAYTIRYMGVAFNPIDAGFTQVSGKLNEAARNLGSSPFRSLLKVDLPNIPSSLKAAAILLLIDILKELPLTMILRPFNFDTLAIRAYEMAGDERLAMAALPSLVIIAMGLLPVFLLSESARKKEKKQ